MKIEQPDPYHADHRSMQSFEVIIVSTAFDKLPTFRRHKMGRCRSIVTSEPLADNSSPVNAALKDEIASLHAFSQVGRLSQLSGQKLRGHPCRKRSRLNSSRTSIYKCRIMGRVHLQQLQRKSQRHSLCYKIGP